MVRPVRPSDDVRQRVEALFGHTRQWRPIDGGYSAAGIWVVQRDSGASMFVKAASTGPTAAFLRDEYAVYSGIDARCMPEVLGWDDTGEYPILVLEDLSSADWPPPWDRQRVAAVLTATNELEELTAPGWLPTWEDQRAEFMRWQVIADDPTRFVASGFADRAWLDRNLPDLIAAEATADLAGSSVVHSDIRSDNVCFAPATKLVDWNWTRRGNPEIDVVAWLPSLDLEGGPAPWEVLPEADRNLVVMVTGFFADHSTEPARPKVKPGVRRLQHRQAATGLRWMERLGFERAPLLTD